jgi:tetratricopeptide (TPR) repeat protein
MHSSVEIDPASESSSAYLGLLYLEIQDTENAQTWLAHTASLHGDTTAARFWQGFAALASEQQAHSETLVDLAQDMSLLATTTYDLVPILHAAQLSSGTPGDAIAWFSARHPQLLRASSPLVNIDNASTTVALIYLLREQGETARAQALLDAALATAALFPSQFRWRGQDAELLALAGRKQEALAALEASFELGWRLNWWMLKLSPALATLRNEPRFNTVVEAAEVRAASQRARVQEMQSRGDLDGH